MYKLHASITRRPTEHLPFGVQLWLTASDGSRTHMLINGDEVIDQLVAIYAPLGWLMRKAHDAYLSENAYALSGEADRLRATTDEYVAPVFCRPVQRNATDLIADKVAERILGMRGLEGVSVQHAFDESTAGTPNPRPDGKYDLTVEIACDEQGARLEAHFLFMGSNLTRIMANDRDGDKDAVSLTAYAMGIEVGALLHYVKDLYISQNDPTNCDHVADAMLLGYGPHPVTISRKFAVDAACINRLLGLQHPGLTIS